MRDRSDEIRYLIQTASTEPNREAILRLLDICTDLNNRISDLEVALRSGDQSTNRVVGIFKELSL